MSCPTEIVIRSPGDPLPQPECDSGCLGPQGPQGAPGAGNQDEYTNLVATSISLGGIPSGATFGHQTMQQMWDALLYPYQAPAFTSFSMQDQPTAVEVGSSVSGMATFVWSTTNSGNVRPNSIVLRDQTLNTVLVSGISNSGWERIMLPTPVQYNSPAANTWAIQGTNSKTGLFTSTFVVNWYWNLYYGTSVNGILTATGIKSLAGKMLATSELRTYSYDPGGYKYLCFPDTFGTPNGFTDQITQISVAMADSSDDPAYSYTANGYAYAIVNVTNDYGQSTSYRVYRTKNILGASIKITVS